jgi:hypothetical protein
MFKDTSAIGEGFSGESQKIYSSEDFAYEQMRQQSRLLPEYQTKQADDWMTKLSGMKIRNPVVLLSIYDEAIRTEKVLLHLWQIKILKEFAEGKEEGKVLRIGVCANNGSGKSQFTIAPCAVWLAMAFKKARAVVTSSSGTQLDRQTGRAILRLCKMVNEFHGQILWKCNYRSFTFLPTGSTIELYATDEEGKAEGYHPHEPGGEFAIFVDEAKSVEEKIFEAIMRCNGMTRRMDVSSPGNPAGHFYQTFQSTRWKTYRITYKDCPHISEDEVGEARERYGENSAWFRSAYLAEFTSINEDVIIPWDWIQNLVRFPVQRMMVGEKFGGLDLSAGGDETVLSLWHGNVQIAMICFKFDDTTYTVEFIKRMLDRYGIKPENINADDGGVGKSMIDMLWRDGYMVKRVRNESVPFDKSTYANRGSEMWYNFGRLIQEKCLWLLPDKTLMDQLSSRYYSRGDVHGKLILESKRLARSRGHGSPDRADATVLAFANKRFPLENFMFRQTDEVILPQRQNLQTLQQEYLHQDSPVQKMLDEQNGLVTTSKRIWNYFVN